MNKPITEQDKIYIMDARIWLHKTIDEFPDDLVLEFADDIKNWIFTAAASISRSK